MVKNHNRSKKSSRYIDNLIASVQKVFCSGSVRKCVPCYVNNDETEMFNGFSKRFLV